MDRYRELLKEIYLKCKSILKKVLKFVKYIIKVLFSFILFLVLFLLLFSLNNNEKYINSNVAINDNSKIIKDNINTIKTNNISKQLTSKYFTNLKENQMIEIDYYLFVSSKDKNNKDIYKLYIPYTIIGDNDIHLSIIPIPENSQIDFIKKEDNKIKISKKNNTFFIIVDINKDSLKIAN